MGLGDGQEQAEMEINVVDKRGVEVEVEMEVLKEVQLGGGQYVN